MAQSYRIEIRSAPRHGEHFQVEAESVEDAAQFAVYRVMRSPVTSAGGARLVNAHRTTGDPGLSGVFQCYRQVHGVKHHQETATGPSFHVSEVL